MWLEQKGWKEHILLFIKNTTFNHAWFYADEITFGKPLGHLLMGAGFWGNQPCDERMEFPAQSPSYTETLRRGEVLESPMGIDLVNHTYGKEPP